MIDSFGIRLRGEREFEQMLLSSILFGDLLCGAKLAESLKLGFGELKQLPRRSGVNISRITLRRYPNHCDPLRRIRHANCVIVDFF